MAMDTKRSYPGDNDGSKLNANEPVKTHEGDDGTVKGVPYTDGTPGYSEADGTKTINPADGTNTTNPTDCK